MSSLPESLKTDRNIAPFIARSNELAQANPVVSYYCKIYVLDHILSNRLHVGNPEVEAFTVSLLDDTETIKASHEDENVRAVLADRQLSLNLVFAFGFRLFTSCLEDLSHYDGTNKIQLASKLRATINFLSVLKVFTGTEDSSLDFSKTSGGKCASRHEFDAFIKEKLKTLKFQLSRLIKDEIPLQGEEEELAELGNVKDNSDDASPFPSAPQDLSDIPGRSESTSPPLNSSSPQLPGSPRLPHSPRLPKSPLGPSSPTLRSSSGSPAFKLPGAPRFDPGSEGSDSDLGPFKLPGAPKFLPDDDLSHINKTSSIQMFPPDNEVKPALPSKPTPKPVIHKPSASETHHKPITKESLAEIIDTTEQIAQIQKHAKFAISALNYEDLETAEKELARSMEILQLVKKHTS